MKDLNITNNRLAGREANDIDHNAECERFNEIALKHIGKVDDEYKEAVESAVTVKYAAGGTLHRGYYCPSPVLDIIVGNNKRGSIRKNSKGATYKYYFDKEGRIIAVDTIGISKEVIFHSDSGSLGLSFDIEGEINLIVECLYSNDLIIEYSKCSFLSYEPRVYEYYKEVYEYLDGKLNSVETYDFMPEMNLLQHNKYIFTHDKKGYLSTYKVIEYEDGEIKKGFWDDTTFKVYVKRKA